MCSKPELLRRSLGGSLESRLIIIGGGDFGRDIAEVALSIPRVARGWVTLAGFLDDEPERSSARMQAAGLGLPILGSPRRWEPAPGDRFICGIAAPKIKLELCGILASRGAIFTNVIDPTAVVSTSAKIGRGVFLWRNVFVGPCAQIGNYATVQLFSSMGHDSVVGEGTTVSAFCDVMGHAQLGRGVFLGSHASILPNAKVGDFARVGAGSVVVKGAASGSTVVGVPARDLGAH